MSNDVRKSHNEILERIEDGYLSTDTVLRELLGWLSASECDQFLEHLKRYEYLPDTDDDCR